MDSLYVCLFSNGHIKVGRSVDPQSRIAAHADRVSCLGVELFDSYTILCNGPSEAREAMLIERCRTAAAKRHQQEWFVGLDFLAVCDWAKDCAEFVEPKDLPIILDFNAPDFRAVVRYLKANGHNQMDMARECNCTQSAISDVASGITKDPRYSIGAALIRMAHEVQAA